MLQMSVSDAHVGLFQMTDNITCYRLSVSDTDVGLFQIIRYGLNFSDH